MQTATMLQQVTERGDKMKKQYISASMQIMVICDQDIIRTSSVEDLNGQDYVIFDPTK